MDPSIFNTTFQELCINDHSSTQNLLFFPLLASLPPQEKLKITLPPLEKPKKPIKTVSLEKELSNSSNIKPIPWRPNGRKRQNDSPQDQTKAFDPSENSRTKLPNDSESDSRRRKIQENGEFVSAHSLISTKPPQNSSPGPKNPLKKPFTCPLRGTNPSEAQKEDSKITGIEEKLIEMIESEIITRNPCVKWDDIAGLEFAKKTVNEAIVWPLKRPDLFKGIRAPPKGLLLFGPPGTGKTMIGKAIASEVSATFFSISASSITSKWVGEGEKLVRVLFALAIKNQPSIIFIDEIDSLLSSRNDGEQEGSRRIKTEFLVQMDGAGTNPNDRILLIGATNRPQELDEAMRRRLAKRMFIPLPNADGRRAILKNLLKSVPNVIGDKEVEEIVKRSKGYSGSDMKNLCTEASMVPLRDIGDISNLVVDEIPPVGLEHFIIALDGIRSSVSQTDIQQLLLWNKDFGSFQFDFSSLDT
ncbi:hypothetical protein SteCoe_15273 [Stentor coeruleus]|uniref:AAA+ ATPase domain-containing protein n=1 Tax=Stentor coeruleus TaxID=5963 RepID=A0A1R2C429_9CILI|nr:hypothetical protein SteCoe_15273 [Stentor coeruleus]